MTNEIDFLRLYEEIYRVLPSRNFQSLMEACYNVTGIPILIVDVAYNLLGIAPDETLNDEMWDFLVIHRCNDLEKITQNYQEGFIQSIDEKKAPYVLDWGSQKEHPRIIGVARAGQSVEAYITMNCTGIEITQDMLKSMETIQNIAGFFFLENEHRSNLPVAYQKIFLIELFNGRIQTQGELEQWFKNVGQTFNPPYTIAAISVQEAQNKHLLSFIQKACGNLCDCQMMLIQGNILYTLYYQEDLLQAKNSFQQSLQTVLKQFHAQCGVSKDFEDLLDLPIYQKQAEDALIVGSVFHSGENSGETVYFYENRMLQAILYPRVRDMFKQSYVPQVLHDIQEYDEQNCTEFFKTLKEYIYNMKATSETAKNLHIHRNTLLYRINKIEEIFYLSLKDYETFLHLMVAFFTLADYLGFLPYFLPFNSKNDRLAYLYCIYK